jgi:hypothetical protein
MANDWPLIGMILALELLWAIGVALWTRWAANAKLQGQTIWHVAMGVAGVISIAGMKIGFEAVGFLTICFALAALPMGIEYFGRIQRDEQEARKVLEKRTDVNASADRKE